MGTRTRSHNLLLIFLAVSALACVGFSAALVGGWKPVDNPNDDPAIQDIAKFAVTEQNKSSSSSSSAKGEQPLVLLKVVKAETQVVAGTNYRLVIRAKGVSGAVHTYEAVVWDKPWEHFRKLTSFRRVKGSY